MTLIQLLEEKRQQVKLERRDVFEESEDEGWQARHKPGTGGVRIKITCKLCGELLASDLKGFDWLKNDSFFRSHLLPHLDKH
jgi:hypothetical protein